MGFDYHEREGIQQLCGGILVCKKGQELPICVSLYEWRLILVPSGRFTIAWTSLMDPQRPRQEIAGSWEIPAGSMSGDCELRPDSGRDSMVRADLDRPKWPRLGVLENWPDRDGHYTWMYMVPTVDPASGRFMDPALIVRGPRDPAPVGDKAGLEWLRENQPTEPGR